MTELQAEERGVGLTWRSLVALVFAAAVVQPAMMYLYLVSGLGLPLSTWIVILLSVGLARLRGQPMTMQEVFIIMAFQGLALSETWLFFNPVKNLYFANSPITEAFGFGALIPSWWAPTGGAAAAVNAMQSYLHPAWVVPLLVSTAAALLGVAVNLAMGYFCYHLYVRVERLEFPLQAAGANSLVVIAQWETESMRILMLAGLGGVLYGSLSYMLPTLTGTTVLTLAPRGLADATGFIEMFVPAVAFGVDLTLTSFAAGFIIPLRVAIAMFIGTWGAYSVGNPVLYSMGVWPEWQRGQGLLWAVQRSQLYFWTSVSIGLALAASFVPLIRHPNTLVRVFQSLSRASGGAALSTWGLLAVFFGATGASVLMVHLLVPEFPVLYLVLFTMGWSFFATLVSANAAGVTYGGFNIPYFREGMIYASGYRGLDIWFSPIGVYTGGAAIAGAFRQADILRCKLSEYVKAYLIVIALGWVSSFAYTSLFWSASAIPSSAYPYTITGWPVETLEFWRWTKWLWSGILFKPMIIAASFAAGAGIYLVTDFLHAPYVLISLLAGIQTGLPPLNSPGFVTSQLVGSAVGHLLIKPRVGPRWPRYAPLVLIGLAVGDSLIVAFTSAVILIGKSQWLLPY